MNQTAWIVLGAVAILGISGWLYMSGNVKPKVSETALTETPPLQVEQVTPPPVTSTTPPAPQSAPSTSGNSAIIHTSMGDITIALKPADAPKTVENFLKLASSGFYSGVKFHRVIKGFMNQTGDPNSKNDAAPNTWGMGGPGYKFDDEINKASAVYQRGYKNGVVAMANAGPNTNGSQFFIMAADYPLPPSYTIFGEVTSGIEVNTKINSTPTDQNDRPLTPVTISSIEIK